MASDLDLAHGIGVQNRYALFYDEDVDPLEILRQQEEEKRKKKIDKTQTKEKKPVKSGKGLPTTVSKKPVDAPLTKTTKQADPVDVPNKSRGGKTFTDRPPRREGGNFPENRESEKNTRNRDEHFFNPERSSGDGEFRRGRGGFRGGRGRGEARGRGYFNNAESRGPRRMFDRHSGSDKTGVRPTDKREGAGSHNWGDMRSDINQRRDEAGWEEEGGFDSTDKNQSTNWGDDTADETKVPEDTPPADNSETKENDQSAEEQIQESVKEMTLDEWKKEQETKRIVPKYNLRKPGEGEDDKQWKKGYVLKKKVKEDNEDDDEEESEDEEYQRKNQKVLLDIQFSFNDSRRGTRGRGRGGRGGPRGGGVTDSAPRGERPEGRGGRRDGPKPRSQQAAPRVDDFNDFPSLVNA